MPRGVCMREGVKSFSFEHYLNMRAAYGPSFSPDGKRLSFITDITGVPEVWSTEVAVDASRPSWPDQLTFRGERSSLAAFSPVDESLLVMGDAAGNENPQLFVLSGDGSSLVELTRRPDVSYVFGGWSPDGSRICYASNERDPRYFDIYEQPRENGEPNRLLQQDGTNYAAGYSPDGRKVLVQRYDSSTRTQLLLVDILTRKVEAVTPEVKNGSARHLAPHWSANGAGLYLLSDRDRQFLSLAWLDPATTQLTYLTDEARDVEGLSMTPDGKYMALVTNVDGYSRLDLFDISINWECRQRLPAPSLRDGVIREVAWSPDGTQIAFTFDAADDTPDVWVWEIQTQVLWRATCSAKGGIPRGSLVNPSLIYYSSFDKREIPAFLYLPETSSPPTDLPFIVYVHGGPESQFRPTFNPIIQYFLAQGYGVLAPNIRGSTGYGSFYQSLDDGRQRLDAVADLYAAVEWLTHSRSADPQRIAIMGSSYGGFMVLSALARYPDLWAAGVEIAGIANFVTFLEKTAPWRRKLRELEYGSLEHDREFLEQISPIHQVHRISTPLFVIHGANDSRVPISEAEQMVTALRERGVPVEYQRFADEGHGLVKRANRLVAYPAIASFLDKYVAQRGRV
jgi:dipeptidyl aminopeptidase/acylaminoacyl peptidase